MDTGGLSLGTNREPGRAARMEDRTGGGQKDTRVGIDVDTAGRAVAGDRRNSPVWPPGRRTEEAGDRMAAELGLGLLGY